MYVSLTGTLSQGYLTAKESRKASIWFSRLCSPGNEGEGVGSGTQDSVEQVGRSLCLFANDPHFCSVALIPGQFSSWST